MNKFKPISFVIGVLIIVFFLMGPYFIVEEGEMAIVTRFGKIIKTESDAGLKFKVPVIDQVSKLRSLLSCPAVLLGSSANQGTLNVNAKNFR